MAFCMAYSLQAVCQLFFKGIYLNKLFFIGIVMSAEAMLSVERISRSRDLTSSQAAYRLVEWIVLVVLLRFSTYWGSGFDPILKAMQNWFKNPVTFISDEKFFVVLIYGGIIWGFVTYWVSSLTALETSDVMIQSMNREGLSSNREQSRLEMLNRFLLFGLGLVVVTVAVRFGKYGIEPDEMRLAEPASIVLLIYFAAGMLLMSQLRFSVLLAGWLWERIPFDRSVSMRWVVSGVLLLILVILLAAGLPSNPVLGLLPSLSFLLDWMAVIFATIFFILSLPLIALVSLVGILFKSDIGEIPTPKLPEIPTMPQVEPGAMPAWFELVKSIVIWIFLIGVFIFALYQYLHQNKSVIQRIRRLGLIRWLGEIWQNLRLSWVVSKEELAIRFKEGLERLGIRGNSSQARNSRFYLHLGSLEPRQKIRFTYLSLLQKTTDAGFPRKLSQSPEEYASWLSGFLPEVAKDIDFVTSYFMEARYTDHEMTIGNFKTMQISIRNVRKSLRVFLDEKRKESTT